MPIQKFRTHAEAEKSLWIFNPDQSYYRKIAHLFDLAVKLNPLHCDRGIHKFRTFEEAQEHRNATLIGKR
jgi:hypothetical protein